MAVLVQKAGKEGIFEGYKVNDDLEIKLIQFADNTIMVGKESWNNLLSIKAIFKGFELVSGLKVNFFKSNIYGVNVDESFMETSSHFLSCCIDILPFKFLGIHVDSNPRRCSFWNPVLDTLRKKLSSWKARVLSIGGRVTLLTSILSSLPIYTMSFFKAPVKIIKEIIKIQSRFLWCGNKDKRCFNLTSWTNICIPKEEGGPGLRHI